MTLIDKLNEHKETIAVLRGIAFMRWMKFLTGNRFNHQDFK